MLKKILFVAGGIIIFISGTFIYGLTSNLQTVTLQEAMRQRGLTEIRNPEIVIIRNQYLLRLYSDSVLVKEYRAVFGTNKGVKRRQNDRGTPVGEYLICRIDTVHRYESFIQLNYPNMEDLNSGLKDGILTQEEFNQLRFRYYYQECRADSSSRMTAVGIHGIGQLNFLFKNLPFVFNWTNGSAAVSNESIHELVSVVKKGTPVVIRSN
ncbi:MAG: L,D-transpeptidase [Ignavibacteriaceae bacterium]|nr:L,D-transpeptidase [Ignavibacteriaceae bacterium]